MMTRSEHEALMASIAAFLSRENITYSQFLAYTDQYAICEKEITKLRDKK